MYHSIRINLATPKLLEICKVQYPFNTHIPPYEGLISTLHYWVSVWLTKCWPILLQRKSFEMPHWGRHRSCSWKAWQRIKYRNRYLSRERLVHRKGGKELNIFIRSDEAMLTLHIIRVAWKQTWKYSACRSPGCHICIPWCWIYCENSDYIILSNKPLSI